MKQTKLWLATIATLLCSLTASAHDFEVDGIYYNITSSADLTVSVTYQGDYYSYSNEYSGTITIPSTVTYNSKTYSVTSITNHAFRGCSSLTAITIPEGVTGIGNNAFTGCRNLISITLPESLTSIENYAFYNCSSLTSITIPESVTSIGSSAFSDCSNLTSITLPESVTSFGSGTFRYCSRLTSITIPEGVTNIEEWDFRNCSSLTSITIPESVKGIESRAFQYCNSLTSITVNKRNTVYDSRNGCNAVIATNSNTLIMGCATTIIPESVTSIGECAFEACSNLTSIIIPEGVTGIGNDAFTGCRNLISITLPESLTSIGEDAFSGCSSLTSIIIPESVTSIGYSAFWDCSNLRNVVIPEGVTNIRAYTFHGCSRLVSITIPGSVTSIGSGAFQNCSSLTSITLPKSVTSIGYSAFWDCSSLTSISIPESVVNIESHAFSYCNSLTLITSHAAVPPVCDGGALGGINKQNCTLHIPEGSLSAYQAADQWKEFLFIKDDVEVEKYVLTYMVDGEVYHTDTIAKKAAISAIAEPTKEGHTFSGWSEIPRIMPENDVTVIGTFAINKYLVAFKVGNEVIDSDSLEYGTTIVIPEAPYKEGYTFDGWGNTDETMPAKDLVIEGKYTANEYLLAFVIDGELYEIRKVRCDEKIVAQDITEKEGYTFIWENWIDKMPAGDCTIRGRYIPNKYAAAYIVDGDTIQTNSIAYGTAITLPEAPTKEGYTFSGWSEAPGTMPAEDITISGTFTINKYLVTFKVGDEVIAADSLEYGATIVAPEAPEREGHTFNGWGEVAETVPAGDVTYESSYTVNSYLLSYTIDGEAVQSDSIAYGTAITLPEAPTKEGYTFSGWCEAPETMPAEDVTISGTFTINKYLVTFKIGDEVIAADSLEYGATIVAPEAPEREGHTFNGWGEVAETVPAGDVTYESSYTVNIYKVYYYVGEELVHTAEVAYGEKIPEYIYEPTKEGDVLEGWTGEPYDTMPAHDVTYTANITNGIEQLTNAKGQLTIYDLNGRKIEVEDLRELLRGIYIVNGHRVLLGD